MTRSLSLALLASGLVLLVAVTTPVLSIDGDTTPAVRELGVTDPLSPDTDGDGAPDGWEYAHGADPTTADTDHDGLDDGRERSLGTDPTAVDTDGDRLPDVVEVRDDERFPGADPTRMDVYVAMTVSCDDGYQRAAVNRTVQAFAEAPVNNPDGSTGIDLHTDVFDTTDDIPVGWYVVLMRASDETTGDPSAGDSLAEMTCWPGDTFMHELGHMLGLNPITATAIDSTAVSFSEYPSVMNYNAPGGFYDYTDGNVTPVDFWPEYQVLADTLPNESRQVVDEWMVVERNVDPPFVGELRPYATRGNGTPGSVPPPERPPEGAGLPAVTTVPVSVGPVGTAALILAPFGWAATAGRREQ